MRGCTCRGGLTLCPTCTQLAQRAGVLAPVEVPAVTERQFQAAVVRLARERGWLVHTVHDSRKSPPGYPDVTLCRGTDLLAMELKVPGGVLTLAQQHWLEALQQVRHVEAGVWVPDDLDHIRRRLC